MKRFFLFSIFISLFFSCSIFATTHYCPETSRHISLGNNATNVEQQCGSPANKTTREEDIVSKKKVIQWIYTFSQDKQFAQKQRPQAMFSFVDGKVIEIQIANQKVDGTAICGNGQTIKIGDDEHTVRRICFNPPLKNTTEKNIVTGKKTINVWTYDHGPHQPKTILEFEKDKLTKIKQTYPGK